MASYKVGDRVRIRSWESMKKEFGIADTGSIDCYSKFTTKMKPLCGRTAAIRSIKGKTIKLTDWSDSSDDTCWNYSTDMIEPIARPSIHITIDGRTTCAVMKDGKKVVRRAEAVCAPTDTFDPDKGAQLAFNRLMYGTDYHPAEVAFRPEPTPEPINLYCVKDYEPGEFLTKGKTYTIEKDGANITYDDGWVARLDVAHANFNDVKIVPNYLVPEVKRPAKVGEWVRFVGNHGGKLRVDTIHKCSGDGIFGNLWRCRDPKKYVVLDGYQPEPEKPKYYNGKVVCVDNCGNLAEYTVGKVYNIVDGRLTGDRGHKINRNDPVDSFQAWCKFTSSKFIEYKGEVGYLTFRVE